MSRTKKYRAVLFDLDGTLLPMDLDRFTEGYMKEFAAKAACTGIAPDVFVQSVWKGYEAMLVNDNSIPNKDAFWDGFCKNARIKREIIEPVCMDYYENEFDNAKAFTGPNPLAISAVQAARKAADHVILATSPIFPFAAQKTRLRWIGLSPDDFDLVTCFENYGLTKPNPQYYRFVCASIGLEPKDCLMIGNDEREDCFAASQAGLDVWLVTDCVIKDPEHPWSGPSMLFKDLPDRLAALSE